MEVKLTKYLFVVLIALLLAVIFVTGMSLVLIDVYVKPLPEQERSFAFNSPEVTQMVEDELPELTSSVMVTAALPTMFAREMPISTAKLGMSNRDHLDLRMQKPRLLTGQVVLSGEISQPLRSYAEPTPVEVVMAFVEDESFNGVLSSVVTEPTEEAVPTDTALPPTAVSAESIVPTAAPTETVLPSTATPTDTAPTPTAEPTELPPVASSTSVPTSDIYTVRYGDSLLSIATKLGVTKTILMEVNVLTDQSVIHPGDELKVPDITSIGVPYIGQIIWPVDARYIIKQYRYGHRAIDIVLPSGSPVVAVAAGTVDYAGWHQHGYGYMVLVDHGNGVTSLYAHNSAFHVKAGDVVEQGQLIADSGNTGNSTMPHLHLELQSNGQMLNPCLYLPDGC